MNMYNASVLLLLHSASFFRGARRSPLGEADLHLSEWKGHLKSMLSACILLVVLPAVGPLASHRGPTHATSISQWSHRDDGFRRLQKLIYAVVLLCVYPQVTWAFIRLTQDAKARRAAARFLCSLTVVLLLVVAYNLVPILLFKPEMLDVVHIHYQPQQLPIIFPFNYYDAIPLASIFVSWWWPLIMLVDVTRLHYGPNVALIAFPLPNIIIDHSFWTTPAVAVVDFFVEKTIYSTSYLHTRSLVIGVAAHMLHWSLRASMNYWPAQSVPLTLEMTVYNLSILLALHAHAYIRRDRIDRGS